MNKFLLLMVSVAIGGGVANDAEAAVIFQLKNVRFSDGQKIEGQVVTNDAVDTILGYTVNTFASTTSGLNNVRYSDFDFPGYGSFYSVSQNANDTLVFYKPESILYLFFDRSIGLGGANVVFSSEDQQFVGSRSDRSMSGSLVVSGADGAVPEPATWALMIAGFGVVGGALRRRRAADTTVRFA